MPKGVFVRGARFYYRRAIPLDVQPVLGRVEIWRSLRTHDPVIARRRAFRTAASVEAEIELARSMAGYPFDATLLQPVSDDPGNGPMSTETVSLPPRSAVLTEVPIRKPPVRLMTLGEAYAAYLDDPTHQWSISTRETYETSSKLAVSVIGAATPIGTLARAHIRDFIDVVRFLPPNAAKRFPRLTAREASDPRSSR